MSAPLRVGLLGLGQRGLQHLKALWQLQSEGLCQVVALGDKFPENLSESKVQQYVPDYSEHTPSPTLTTTDFSHLLKQNLDVLYICLPPNVHNGEVIQAAESGIHLFVEKPMSLYLNEALAMENAINKAGILSCVGFQQRFESKHEQIESFLQGKEAVMATYTMHAPFEGHNVKHTRTESEGGPVNRVWTANKAWSGMTVVEGGIHPLDLWRFWFGDVEWVQATYNHRPPAAIIDGADNPYAYSVLFGFENGATGNMRLSRLRQVYSTYSEHQVLWTTGRVAIEGTNVVAYSYEGAYPPESTPTAEEVRKVLESPERKDPTVAIARSFLMAVQTNRPEQIRSPFGDAMNSLAAVLGANVSDRLNGQRIDLHELLTSPQFESFRTKPV